MVLTLDLFFRLALVSGVSLEYQSLRRKQNSNACAGRSNHWHVLRRIAVILYVDTLYLGLIDI